MLFTHECFAARLFEIGLFINLKRMRGVTAHVILKRKLLYKNSGLI